MPEAEQGMNVARIGVLLAGLPDTIAAQTVNRFCSSGLQAVAMAADQIRLGNADLMLAGGTESMSMVPMMGNKIAMAPSVFDNDHVAIAYGMGITAEKVAEEWKVSREEQDAFAIESVRRAQAAQADGAFADEIVPVKVAGRKGEVEYSQDEQPGRSDIAKIPTLRPAFKKDGTVTAASSSSISDGAAALVLLSEDDAAARGVTPLARIVAHATHSQEPEWFTTAPIGALHKVLEKAGWQLDQVDLFEINEAFAVVAMAPMRELGIPHDKLNVNGGACALGHPIGASGARLVVTLVNALRTRGGKRGIATLCIGGGEATAIAIELI